MRISSAGAPGAPPRLAGRQLAAVAVASSKQDRFARSPRTVTQVLPLITRPACSCADTAVSPGASKVQAQRRQQASRSAHKHHQQRQSRQHDRQHQIISGTRERYRGVRVQAACAHTGSARTWRVQVAPRAQRTTQAAHGRRQRGMPVVLTQRDCSQQEGKSKTCCRTNPTPNEHRGPPHTASTHTLVSG